MERAILKWTQMTLMQVSQRMKMQVKWTKKTKLWVRTGISVMLCDFDVYQGSVDGIRQAKSELGLSGDVVMKLASTLPEGQNYKIYADNYFTGVPLVVKLLEQLQS
ncbi:piggyBac transposable element-derived protein 3-like [Tachysurus ichikawai]